MPSKVQADNRTLQEIYNTFAATYEHNRGLFDMSEVLDDFYSRLASQTGALLDLGCGAGEPVARYFSDRHWSITGVDFSEQMLALAAKYVPQMQTIHADIQHVEFEPNQFSAIIASYSLFHIPASAHTGVFSNIHQWLKPEGKALFTYATQAYTGAKQFDGHKEFMGQELYYSHKETEELYDDLNTIGFDIEATDHRDIGGEEFLWVTVSRR